MSTVGPTGWVRHYSPVIGRLTGVRVLKDEGDGDRGEDVEGGGGVGRGGEKYDFQANEIQLAGPVPAQLRHRYVEFRPVIKRMFTSRGLRGAIMHSLLHRQHARIYNFDAGTEYGTFDARSEAASLQFLRMAHFAGGGRIFTYVLTLDGVLRFTETGGEFGIDMLSKHTMHSDVAMYVAYAGEFFVKRVVGGGGHSGEQVETDYQLVIDNDSGTYRPDASELGMLQGFLADNLPGIDVVAMDWKDEKLAGMKREQLEAKRRARARGSIVESMMG
ncbi:hypothetical protein C8A05DRAFT_35763, partial [Staphylotrichum tortipilum]